MKKIEPAKSDRSAGLKWYRRTAGWIEANPGIGSAAALTLRTLAHIVRDQGHGHIKQSNLCQLTGLSRTSLRTALRKLETHNVIKIEVHAAPGQTNRYTIDISAAYETPFVAPLERLQRIQKLLNSALTLKHSPRAVLRAICDHKPNSDGWVHPTIKQISRRACCCPRTVHASINKLEEAGLLEVRRSPGRAPNKYRFKL